MDIANLINPSAAAIVIGGTLLATALRAGREDTSLTIQGLVSLVRPSFPAETVRGEVAALSTQIRIDGMFRARPRHLGDAAFDDAIDAMIEGRSLDALYERHAVHCKERVGVAMRALRTLTQAADLAPVFGLAGTLISLSQLPSQGIARSMFMGAISMSVLTTLYGLLLANFILAPLARAIERRSDREEAARQEIIDWLAGQVVQVLPHTPPHPMQYAQSHHLPHHHREVA
jgi:chemotaxis protein MotA